MSMDVSLNRIIIVLICCGLTACTVGPNFHSPAAPKTRSYTANATPTRTVSIAAAGQVGQAQLIQFGRDIPANWWTLFHSKAINALISKGLAHSPNLTAAQATLREAQQNLKSKVGSLLFPSVSLDTIAERVKSNKLGLTSSSNSSSTPPGTTYSLYYATVPVRYTLDLFGGSRREIEEYRAKVDFARYALMAAYLTLTSNIVTTALTVATLEAEKQEIIALIRETQQQTDIVRQQFYQGGVARENVLIQETSLAQTKAELPPIELELAQARHSLAVLVGALPSQIHLPPLYLSDLRLPKHLPLSLPSTLVKQRPDVQEAEANLHVASAAIGVATAALFPRISLSAKPGFSALAINKLFESGSYAWALAAEMTQTLFQGGSLLAAKKAAIASYKYYLAEYKETVLTAFQNVADSLRALEIDARNFKQEFIAEQNAKYNYEIIRKSFKEGGSNYLELLTAQQQYQTTKVTRLKAEGQRYTDTVALFQSLGGGWWNSKEMYEKRN